MRGDKRSDVDARTYNKYNDAEPMNYIGLAPNIEVKKSTLKDRLTSVNMIYLYIILSVPILFIFLFLFTSIVSFM